MSTDPHDVVQCGWCPVILPNDPTWWYFHFEENHYSGGYSIKHNIKGPDWDVAELTANSTATIPNRKD